MRVKNFKEQSSFATFAGIFAILAFISLFSGFLSGDFITGIVFALVFSSIAFVLGIIALVVILFSSKQLKGLVWAIAAILFSGVFLSFELLPGLYRVRETREMDSCRSNLEQLGIALIGYAKDHDGRLPTSTRWCDLLMEYDKKISKSTFKCPAGKREVCHYAFNKSLDGLSLDDIPDNVAILFEAEGDWNLAGGIELVKKRHGDGLLFNVLFSDGHVIPCRKENFVEQTLFYKN